MKGSRGTRGQIKKENANVAQVESMTKGMEGAFDKILKEGQTPKDALNVSPNVMETIYAHAYRLYNTGKYIEAVHLFRMLILFNAMESKYSLGLAACFHMLKEYKNAIQTYTMCAIMDPTSPIPHYHSSDCFIQMKDYLSAMVCLQMAIDIAANQPQYAKIKERAQLSLESLKQQDNPSTPFPMEESDFQL